MKFFRYRDLVIIILCFTIICLGMAFCVLSNDLSKYKKNGTKYNISITKIVDNTINKNDISTSNYKIINNGKTVDFVFYNKFKKDELSFTIFIKNKGDIDGCIDTVIESLNYDKKDIFPINIKYNNIDKKIIKKGEVVKLKVIVDYSKEISSSYLKIPYKISILTSSLN